MAKIQSLSLDLNQALLAVRAGRSGLDRARQDFAKSSLGILAAYKRRQRAASLLQDLEIIGTLQKTDARLQELLSEGNYPGAIRLLTEGQKAVETYKHFTAIQVSHNITLAESLGCQDHCRSLSNFYVLYIIRN